MNVEAEQVIDWSCLVGHQGNNDLSTPQLVHRNHEDGLHKTQYRNRRRFKESTDGPCVDSRIVELLAEQMLLFG